MNISIPKRVQVLATITCTTAILALPNIASAEALKLFNTGVSDSGVQLSSNSADPHWNVVSGPGITTPIQARVVQDQSGLGFYRQSTNSRWIWTQNNALDTIDSPFQFRLAIDLSRYDHTTASISGLWSIDNFGYIRMNGAAPIGTGTFAADGTYPQHFINSYSFSINGGFVAGINYLDFFATDTGNPGGLNVSDLTGSAQAVPEPASIALLFAGGVVVLVRIRHSRQLEGDA